MTLKAQPLQGNDGDEGGKAGQDLASEAHRIADSLASSAEIAVIRQTVVIDTNIILDVFVFADAAAKPVRQALDTGKLDWIATQPMRDELARVLDYPQIVPRLAFYRLSANDVLAAFDRHARLLDIALKARLNCSDPDDQKFIDLAVAEKALLLSKDRHVLSMSKRLLALGVRSRAAL